MAVTKYPPYDDAASQAALIPAIDRPTAIPGEVDQESIVSSVDAGTSIPGRVNEGIIPPKVDRPA